MSTILHACQVYILYVYIKYIIACIIVIMAYLYTHSPPVIYTIIVIMASLYTHSPPVIYTCYVIPAKASNQSFIKNVNCGTVFIVSYYLNAQLLFGRHRNYTWVTSKLACHCNNRTYNYIIDFPKTNI